MLDDSDRCVLRWVGLVVSFAGGALFDTDSFYTALTLLGVGIFIILWSIFNDE